MAIGQIEIQGQITRAQDFTTIKHHEDTRDAVEQSTLGEQTARQVEGQLTRVNQKEKAENQNNKFDAKEKGSNEYSGDGGRGRKKEETKPAAEPDGKVLLKGVGDFDLSL